VAEIATIGEMVECLQCGERREQPEQPCPKCTYVGWAWVGELDEALRRLLRERPPVARGMRVV
jgi:hypothetical protein